MGVSFLVVGPFLCKITQTGDQFVLQYACFTSSQGWGTIIQNRIIQKGNVVNRLKSSSPNKRILHTEVFLQVRITCWILRFQILKINTRNYLITRWYWLFKINTISWEDSCITSEKQPEKTSKSMIEMILKFLQVQLLQMRKAFRKSGFKILTTAPSRG